MERRKANDGQFYSFSEFVAWYGDRALGSWMKVDAAEDIAADGAGKHDVQAGVSALPTAPAPNPEVKSSRIPVSLAGYKFEIALSASS